MIASLISALYLMGLIAPENAWTFLYISGGLLIAGEIALGGHGLLIFNSFLAFFVGYTIQMGRNPLFQHPFDWNLLFGISFVEMVLLVAFIVVTLRYRRLKASTGTGTMIGAQASILTWQDTSGTVSIEGETWKARSETAMNLTRDEKITVKAVDGLTLLVGK